MFRQKVEELIAWKNSTNRKPLIINGARQVGKSWLVNHFGDKYFDGKTIVVNFDLYKKVATKFIASATALPVFSIVLFH